MCFRFMHRSELNVLFNKRSSTDLLLYYSKVFQMNQEAQNAFLWYETTSVDAAVVDGSRGSGDGWLHLRSTTRLLRTGLNY